MPQTTITLAAIKQPEIYLNVPSVVLNDPTIEARRRKIFQGMAQQKLDSLVVYADKEHGGNFEYLTDFIPRFEEGLLVLHKNGEAVLVLGNENLKLAQFSRTPANVVHAPWFSLPNQPMDTSLSLSEVLQQAGLNGQQRVGIAGWKLFTGNNDNNTSLFDIPTFIFQALQAALTCECELLNATSLFISPRNGARIINNANEIAHYEYGANLASSAALTALNAVELGKTEKSIAALLAAEGQANNVVTIAATGDRFENANLYPSDKQIQRGDKFSLTVSYKGGLTSRAAYVVSQADELHAEVSDYLDVVAIPYYRAVVAWLEYMHVGVKGHEVYELIERVLPKTEYHWHLNPGHLVADEEWLCSPIYPASDIALSSGMLLQIDIIPSRKGYAGASIEDTIALADESLRQQLATLYPALWQRISARRKYLDEVLNIKLHEDVLPLSNTVGYLRPYLLNKGQALVKNQAV
ncbi:creatinase/aminopeptidase P [Buttiauxella brennerae ATCC 51605]|uniref:Creatinase/aminopeptidase P n=1 Tax=Buttiauxella brennerae ATCC 51605 TaxID=1354251 RepID=A0A1B7IHV3_9ENTR|nr:M24 family metallopeptidase [Buttiauxella brennerae]OAT29026.1 creatinase/aminopeptidase P [Buttiauxella brennerae ATCC 51605]